MALRFGKGLGWSFCTEFMISNSAPRGKLRNVVTRVSYAFVKLRVFAALCMTGARLGS